MSSIPPLVRARSVHLCICALALVLLAPVAALAGSDPAQPAPAPTSGKPAWQMNAFPDDRLFHPLLADMKEPRFFASYRQMHFLGPGVPTEGLSKQIGAGLVAMGGELGLWSLGRIDGDWTAMVGMLGGIFSQFNLDAPSTDLINSDFMFGLPVTVRRGPTSARLRLYHQSSHLGDEFLAHSSGVKRLELSFEAVDLLVSLEHSFWRVYGGGAYVLRAEVPVEPARAQWGVELRGPSSAWLQDLRARAVGGADFNWLAARDHGISVSIKGGVEWTPDHPTRKLRFLFVYAHGYLAYGQFFNTERVEDLGIETQIEL